MAAIQKLNISDQEVVTRFDVDHIDTELLDTVHAATSKYQPAPL